MELQLTSNLEVGRKVKVILGADQDEPQMHIGEIIAVNEFAEALIDCGVGPLLAVPEEDIHELDPDQNGRPYTSTYWPMNKVKDGRYICELTQIAFEYVDETNELRVFRDGDESADVNGDIV